MEAVPLRAAPVVDRLERDGRTIILLAHQVVELSPLALAIYDAAQRGATASEVVDELVELFGRPPEGTVEDAVTRVVGELTGLGLLEA